MPALLPRGEKPQPLGARPVLKWVRPTDLLVDDTYQRELKRRSIALISGMVRGFMWRKMKPPIVVQVGKDLHCVNGQHTAIGAATLGIKEIPVFVVEASTVEDRADAFVSHNRDHIPMTPLDLHHGAVGAANQAALTVQHTCKRAGIRLRAMSHGSKIEVGDCSAVSTIYGLIKRRGANRAKAALEALVKGGRAPVSAAEITAVELVMCGDRPDLDADTMATVIRDVGSKGLATALAEATIHRLPVKEVLRTKYNAGARKAAAA